MFSTSKKKNKTKIPDIPTAKEMNNVLPLLKVAAGTLGFLDKLGINKDKFGAMAAGLVEQAKILKHQI